MKLGTLVTCALGATVAVGILSLFAPWARAQDVEEQAGVEVDRADVPAAEAVEAWALPDEQVVEAADVDAVESDAFAHIHDADAELPELEAAERMVGFDLLDGVR